MALKINKELESTLIAIMVDTHKALDGLNARLKADLSVLLSDYILAVASIPQGASGQLDNLTTRLYGDIVDVLNPYLDEYEEMATEAHREALEAVVGQGSGTSGIMPEEMEEFLSTIAEAREKTASIVVAMMQEISLTSKQMVNQTSPQLLDGLVKAKDSLNYQLRRHLEAFLSLSINQGVVQGSEEKGYKKWYWQIHPELTRSGTCPTCKKHSVGGANSDGVYTLEDLPMIPVHPHCVCVLIPVE